MLFLKIFAIFTGKHLCWSFFNKVAGLKAYFEEHLRTVTSFNQEVFYRNQTCHYFSSFFLSTCSSIPFQKDLSSLKVLQKELSPMSLSIQSYGLC